MVQWYWLYDTHPNDDQFNSIHERLIDRWREISPAGEFIHFACDTDSYEDVGNIRYLMDTACQADCTAALISIKDIGVQGAARLHLSTQKLEAHSPVFQVVSVGVDVFRLVRISARRAHDAIY